MSEFYGFPKDFTTGDELISLLYRSERAKAAANNLGVEKWPGEDGEIVMPDRVLFTRLGLMFDYLSRYHPEAVITQPEFGTRAVETVEIVSRGPQYPAYHPRFSPQYLFEQQPLWDDDQARYVNYIIRRKKYEPDLGQPIGQVIFNKQFDCESGAAVGGYDTDTMLQALETISKPNLFLKAHLDESKLGWKKRQWLAKRRGRIAVKYHRLNPDIDF
jgi:hypothetical protein